MKKKGYKQMQRKMLREVNKYAHLVRHENQLRILAEGNVELAKREAENYRKRIREIGMNMETIDPGPGMVKCVEWTMNPQAWGNYVWLAAGNMDEIPQEALDDVKDELARSAVESAARNELIQYIIKGKDEDPQRPFTTIGGKIYIVPWEQMPYRKTIKLRQLIDEVLDEEEKP